MRNSRELASAINSFLYPHGSIFGNREHDVFTRDDKVVISVDLPGLSEGDVDISIEGTTLIIEAKKETERRNTSYGKSFNIEGFNGKNVKAVMSNGVLEIELEQAKANKANKVKVISA
jgi:HSP20 family molecular chaperone IbpA